MTSGIFIQNGMIAQNQTVGWIYCLTIATKALILLRENEDFYVYSRILLATLSSRKTEDFYRTRQVILLVFKFLLFRIKKDQNKTKRLQESIRSASAILLFSTYTI